MVPCGRRGWRWLLGVGLLALRDFVTPTEDLAAAQGMLLEALEALEALKAFFGDDLVSTIIITLSADLDGSDD